MLKTQGELEENLIGLSMAMSAFPAFQKDALTTLQFAPQFSDAWTEICRRNKRMLEATERFLQNSIWLPLIGVGVAYGVAIAENHGVNLLGFMGVKKEERQSENNSETMSEEQRAQLLMLNMVERQNKRNAELSGVE